MLGCSDGAIVALFAALLRPELVRRLVLVAGVFHRDGWHPATEFAPEGHDPESFIGKMSRMHRSEPTLEASDLAAVRSRTLVMIGDDDEVLLEHAAELYGGLPDGELAVVPGAYARPPRRRSPTLLQHDDPATFLMRRSGASAGADDAGA